MAKFIKWTGAFLLAWYVVLACVEPYDPPLDDADLNHLVVNGFLNTSAGSATIALSRTQPVKVTEKSPPESGASVYIEDDVGTMYPLFETTPGNYSGPVSHSASARRYRLIIKTGDSHEYASDFVVVLDTPPIDSISYTPTREAVEFEVNTHDPTDQARHFRWKYVETYEYHSAFNSNHMFTATEIIERPPDQAINFCWKTNSSTEIIIGSNQHLQKAVTRKALVTSVPKGSVKISVKYSLLVQQQALTPEEYNYWLNLRKSTEQLGGLFDPLPSEVTGNIHSTTHPGETVLGYFGGGTVQELRRTVRREQLPPQLTMSLGNVCITDTLLVEDIPVVSRSTLLIDEAFDIESGQLIGYTSSIGSCIDCRLMGGTTQMPEFWE